MTLKMRAIAVKPGEKNSATLITTEKPTRGESEVLVKVLRVGFDGTDQEINDGLYGEAPEGADFLILGHESLGRVEEVGENVENFKEGDLVVPMVRRPCPENCLNCRNKEYDMCLTGHYKERGVKGLHGFMAEYYVERPEYLIKIPREQEDVGVLLEPLSIVEKAISQIFEFQKRLFWKPENALVLGAGPIGLFATMILRTMRMNTYTMATREKTSLKARLVTETGAEYVNAREEPLSSLRERTQAFDIIFEATGNSHLAIQSINALGNNGVLCLTGISGGNKTMTICADCVNTQLVLGNKVIFGTVNSNRKHFEMGLKHFFEFKNRWPGLLNRMITRRVKLQDFASGFIRDKEDVKTVIEITS